MRNIFLISACLISGLTLGACATTKPAAPVQVRPVLMNSSPTPQLDFDIETALADAQKLRRSSDYGASYDAYNALFMRIKSQETAPKIRADILLGLADSALSLGWRAEKYETRAFELYSKISEDIDNSEDHKSRTKSGLLLLEIANLKPDAAEEQLRLALEGSPNDPRLWNALGKLHDNNMSWLKALDAYVQALTVAKQIDSSTAAVVNNMGMSLLMQGRKKEALAKFKQANKSNPDMPVYDNNLRLAQTLSGKTKAALKGLSEIRAAQIYNDAGVIAQAQGKPKKARKFYKKAIEQSPVYFVVAEKNLAGLLSGATPDKAEDTPA